MRKLHRSAPLCKHDSEAYENTATRFDTLLLETLSMRRKQPNDVIGNRPRSRDSSVKSLEFSIDFSIDSLTVGCANNPK